MMFPQSELDNYKLQVELLQEKLKRSEEQRHHLEEKFENVMKRRSEHENSIRNAVRRKYQSFLEEQKDRDERNKKLIKMLERVDQQAITLAARTERLRMLKIQYELYFTKMLQFQYIKSIQSGHCQQPIQLHNRTGLHNVKPEGIEEIFQSTDNCLKGASLGDNWNSLANNISPGSSLSNVPVFGSYRFPRNSDFLNGLNEPSLSNPGTQRQVNLKSTFADSISPTYTGLTSQTKLFSDMRNTIDLSRYEMQTNVNITTPNRDDNSNNCTSSSIKINNDYELDKANENLNESQASKQVNSDIFMGRGGSNRGMYNENEAESQLPKYLNSKTDTLHSLRQDKMRDEEEYEVDDNDSIDNDNGSTVEKYQSTNIRQIQEDPQKETKQNIDDTEDVSMIPEKKISIAKIPIENVLKDISKISLERVKKPITYNFGSELKTKASDYPLEFKKKEKLSIENIENAIYGERIDPIARKMNEYLQESEPIEKYGQQISSTEYIKDEKAVRNEIEGELDLIDSCEEKKDLSEKEALQLESNVYDINEENVQSENIVDNAENDTPKTNEIVTTSEIPVGKPSYDEYPEAYEQSFYSENKPGDIKQQDEVTIDSTTIYQNYDLQQQPNDIPLNLQYAQEPTEAEVSAESNIYQNNSEINMQNQYNNAQYEGGPYSYQEQQNYYQNQQYDQNEYPQQEYQTQDSQQYEYTTQPEYDQTYQDGVDYNYAYDQNPNEQFQSEDYQQNTAYATQPYDEGINPDVTYSNPEFQQEYNQIEYELPKEALDNTQYSQDIGNNEDISQKIEEQLPENIVDPKNNPIYTNLETANDPLINVPNETITQPTPLSTNQIVPTSILSTEKQSDPGNGSKKKKKVNFIDSETDENYSAQDVSKAPANNNESDYDFSSN